MVGNIVSEWTQLLGLVLLTKKLIEDKSKESRWMSIALKELSAQAIL